MVHETQTKAGLIREKTASGVTRSTVNCFGARLVFAAAAPREGSTFAEQAQDVLGAVKRCVEEEGPPVSIVGQSVFLADIKDRSVFQRMMPEFFGGNLPATTYIAQRPCDGKRLAVELWGVENGNQPVEIERVDEELVAVRSSKITLVQLAYRHRATTGEAFFDAATAAYKAIDRRLMKFGFRFDQIVRTWFFIEKITAVEDREPRYEQLNRARTESYRDLRFAAELLPQDWNGAVYPASTGVGAEGNDLTVSCLAIVAKRSDVVLFPLENPLQTPAYDYDDKFGEESPKFARAMAVVSGDRAMTFISGTASITTSDSKHLENIERQTHLTLDNIAALISADNFHRHGFTGFGATLGDLACVRVYLKRAEDYRRASAICRDRLGELPTVFVVCDLCRPELLVEIEGVAFSRRSR